jgi:hypothetical protein
LWWLGFQQYQNERKQEGLIGDKLQAAKECFYQQSYDCAIDNARVVTSMVPGNSEARELLKAAELAQQKSRHQGRISRLLQESRACLGEDDYGCAKVKAREVLDMEPGEAQALQLLEKIARASHRQTIGGYLVRANSCLDRGDVDCANSALDEAKAAGAEPAELYEARKRVDTLVENLLDETRQLDETIRLALDDAQACFRSKNYDCANSKADEVLALERGNAEAIEIQQSIKLAQAQQRANEKTVASFLRDADACYQRKNYSCAIAKSESALAILPNSANARAMKKRAENSQNKAKRSISID